MKCCLIVLLVCLGVKMQGDGHSGAIHHRPGSFFNDIEDFFTSGVGGCKQCDVFEGEAFIGGRHLQFLSIQPCQSAQRRLGLQRGLREVCIS